MKHSFIEEQDQEHDSVEEAEMKKNEKKKNPPDGTGRVKRRRKRFWSFGSTDLTERFWRHALDSAPPEEAASSENKPRHPRTRSAGVETWEQRIVNKWRLAPLVSKLRSRSSRLEA